ncbi:MAG: hypothetical protein MK184_08545 [Acidimicrobiales bacterium]|nr:hypothetical protein [Acidimicrobiales bacterium]
MVALLHTSGGDAGTIIGNRYRLERQLAVTARTEVWSGHAVEHPRPR